MYGSGQWPVTYLNVLNSTRHFMSMWHQESGACVFERTFGTAKPRMRFVDHHLAHAISAYAYSGFDDAAVVVMDGRGAWEATSIWHGRNGTIEHVLTIPFPNSIGGFYSAFTEYLGFVPNSDEWKVMGLAPYGEPGIKLDQFIDTEGANGTPYQVHTKRLNGGRTGIAGGIAAALGAPRVAESEIDDRHKNVAFAVQDYCERAMMSVVRAALAENEEQKSLPRRRRGAEFESERKNSGVGHGRQNFCAARGFGRRRGARRGACALSGWRRPIAQVARCATPISAPFRRRRD